MSWISVVASVGMAVGPPLVRTRLVVSCPYDISVHRRFMPTKLSQSFGNGKLSFCLGAQFLVSYFFQGLDRFFS
jgi:hypothetical protein